MPSRSISDLSDAAQAKFKLWDEGMKKKNLPYIITCTARSFKEQVALYAQGRQSLDEVNILRKAAKLDPLPLKDSGGKLIKYYPVTWTLASRHIINLDDSDKNNDKANAWDFVILKGRVVLYDMTADVNADNTPDYEQAAQIAESVGAKPGMRFKDKKGQPNPDPCHIEV